ncbi:MAG: Bor/Iss family lipoprotein [Chitinispirillaceae bacterium]
MKIVKALVVFSVLLLANCTVMHFENGKATGAGVKVSKWHHNAIFSLVEASEPISTKEYCGEREWKRVTTKRTVISSIVGAVDQAIIGIDLWDPQVVDCECE